MGLVTYFSLCLLGCLTYNPSLAAPSLSVEAQAMSCPTGWFSYHDSCYRFFHTKKNWMEAEAHCQHHSHGAHLASIHSAGENKMLAHYIKKYYKENCAIWIGLSDPMEVSARCPLCLGQPLPRPLGSVSLLTFILPVSERPLVVLAQKKGLSCFNPIQIAARIVTKLPN
nr:C-type lectin-like [Chrysemys picta bellii]